VPRDFDTIEVPFPEKGEPELVSLKDLQARTPGVSTPGWRRQVGRRAGLTLPPVWLLACGSHRIAPL